MRAKELVKQHGESLLGRKVLTHRYGAWPGGIARIIKIAPDPSAPEIVFEVSSQTPMVERAIKRGDLDGYEIGVFDHEEVELV